MLLEKWGDYCSHKGAVEMGKSRDRYYYRIFGLDVVSDIVLPELVPAIDPHGSPEISISVGKVPDNIAEAAEKTESYQAAKNQFLLQIPAVARYYVTNGNCIMVEPAEQAEARFVRLFLLGTAFGSLLMQRGILPLHGSAVVTNGWCVIITGMSGAGKSTLAAAFRERGYAFLTDDIAAVTVKADGTAWVYAAYPQQKLWRDSAKIIGVDTVSLLSVFRGVGEDKFSVPVQQGFWQSPVPLAAVYELEVAKCQQVTMRPLVHMDKLAVLMSHTYRPWLLKGLGLTAAHFQQCTAVARQIAVARLTRPEGVFSLAEQVRLVQQDLAQLLAGRAV